ncbi:hypothetical protein [Thaumasiovibrio subtropicus]|uniref:hypothetical protein n=1 Tax=Thaumasiovibrio subtropicus TaxID=1891207 RepID=UPI000B36404D|nr:hypothetical protein [Thaumasiovibrio subtropicus]
MKKLTAIALTAFISFSTAMSLPAEARGKDDRPGWSHSKPGHNKPGHNKPGHNKPNRPGHHRPGYNRPGYGKPPVIVVKPRKGQRYRPSPTYRPRHHYYHYRSLPRHATYIQIGGIRFALVDGHYYRRQGDRYINVIINR